MIFNFVYINAPSDLLRYPECNQISILGNRTPVREIDAQTEKKITELPDHVETRVPMKLVNGCLGMGDIRNYYFSDAGALPGNGNFHQNIIVLIFSTPIITSTH